MNETSYDPSVDIIRAMASFLSTIAAAIASFASVATLVGASGGKNVVTLQGNEVMVSLLFLVFSLLASLLMLGLSCTVLSFLKKV